MFFSHVMITNIAQLVLPIMQDLICSFFVAQIQSQLLHLTDTLPEDLPALLEVPLTLEQGCASSTHTTTEEEETDEISGLSEDLQRYQFTQIPSLANLSFNSF